MSLRAAFASVVGEEAVVDSADPAFGAYRDPYSFDDEPGVEPLAAVRPSSVEEVCATLVVAGEHGLHVWPVSRGRNFAYGGARPCRGGGIVCDLSRMDRVLEVDERCGVAVVEPGVSFEALDAHLRATGSGLAVSVPDLAWGSLIGNTLERGFSYTSHNEHQATFCGLEVVLANGEVIRTGMGALPGTRTWAHYRGSFGPSLDGLFLQSNFGVVTKMGIWLRRRPARAAACSIAVPERGQLGELVETLRPLLLDGTVQSNVVIGNAVAATSLMAPRERFHDGAGPMPEPAIRAAMADLDLGWWNAELGLYGSSAMIEARRAELEAAVAGVSGARLNVTVYPGDVDPADVQPAHRTQLGIPSNDAVAMAAFRGGRPAHSDLGVICRPTAEDVTEVNAIVAPILEAAGLDHAAGFMQFPRHVVALSLLIFDGDDADQRARVGAAIRSIIEATSATGYGTYRSHVAHMDLVASQYAHNDHAALRLAERIKDTLDPTGLLAPGKQGLWPRGAERERHAAATTA